jgi:hypothetical protein
VQLFPLLFQIAVPVVVSDKLAIVSNLGGGVDECVLWLSELASLNKNHPMVENSPNLQSML